MGDALRPPLRAAAGPIAVETGLLDEMAPWIDEIRGEPRQLADPVWVVVPSRSLREHLCAAIVARFGSVVGVSVRTLTSLALEIGEGSGRSAPAHSDLGWILVRQLAREETALRDGFEGFLDGYGAVEAAVSDLLDAGFEAHHAESVEEGILASGGTGPEIERARALVRVAARAEVAFAKGPVGHRSQLFRAARESIELDPEAALPGRALFLHGFSDATGVQSDLIEALVRVGGARIWLDRSPVVGADVGELAFGRRFRERLEGVAGGIEVPANRPERPRVAVLYAPGPHAEARAVAVRIRALLDAGARAERIGVVARSLTAYGVPLRLHFHRLGIPFSALSERGPAGAAGRQLIGLLEVLAEGARTPAERWLDVQALPGRSLPTATGVECADLRLYLHARGVARLADVARLELRDEDTLALPVRSGRSVSETGDVGRPRRHLERGTVARAIAAAATLCARLDNWPESDRLDAHRMRLRQVVDEDLGWRRDRPVRSTLDPLDPLDELDAALRAAGPDDFELTRADFLLLLNRVLNPRVGSLLGGEGAGVQVLNVMEARARTFDHLFVVGLGRNLFPRTVTEDLLLPDPLRRRLRAVLPELPVKAEGRSEERFLFAQLVAASPAVTLTCPITDDDGKAQAPSPLVEGLVADWNLPDPERVPWLFGSRGLGLVEPRASRPARPAHEHAVLAGLYGSRRRFEGVLRMALDEARGANEDGAADSSALARSRCAVLTELDPTGGLRRELGPYFGFTGERQESPPTITTLESIAHCPWQTFLGRVLGLDPPPDALGALPRVEPRTLGNLVHHVLERIARDVLGDPAEDLEAALKRDGAQVDWPDAETLDPLIRRCAESAAREQGISLPGFARILALEARRRLALAREHDWPIAGAGPTVLGAELTGSVRVRDAGGRIRTLGFRADRVDRSDEGLCFTDYKTGKPGPRQTTRAAREKDYRSRVEAGVLLQAAAYAHAGGRHGPARGRYLYLNPDVAPELSSFEVRSDDLGFAEAFENAVRILLGVWDRGSFTPRLVDTRGVEPRRCATCEVKVACLRGDSGARRRLAEWTRRSGADRREVPAEAALRSLWSLGKES